MPDTSQPVPVKKLRGKVSRGVYAKGSKSEREALFVDTGEGRFVLRRKGGPAFADPTLERYYGHEVECDGFLVGRTLLAERIAVVG
jgi:hypothetical protein